MAYGYIGSMKTKPGYRDDVVAILLNGVDSLREAGCSLYVVSVPDTDDVTIWVSEVWQTKGHHDASLQLPETQAAISKTTPMLTGRVHQPGTDRHRAVWACSPPGRSSHTLSLPTRLASFLTDGAG